MVNRFCSTWSKCQCNRFLYFHLFIHFSFKALFMTWPFKFSKICTYRLDCIDWFVCAVLSHSWICLGEYDIQSCSSVRNPIMENSCPHCNSIFPELFSMILSCHVKVSKFILSLFDISPKRCFKNRTKCELHYTITIPEIEMRQFPELCI